MHIQTHLGIILFTKCSILNAWEYSEYTSALITAQLFVQWPYAMYCIRHQHIQRHTKEYSSIFTIIKTHQSILKNCWGIFSLIQAYSEPCVAFSYSWPCHISNPGIFRTRHNKNLVKLCPGVFRLVH